MSTESGYQAPSVTVATSLPKRGADSSVLIVPVVSTGEDDKPGAAVASAEPFLSSGAVAEIESGLRALEATGGAEQVHRLVVPSLPVSSVLTIGLGKPRSEWPADTIRRAAGVAARSLGKTESVITTLAELPGEGVGSAAVEGLILGSYRFTEFRSDKTAPKDKGLQKITVLATAKDAKNGRRARRGRGDRRCHRARLRQHPAQPPVSRRIRQARKGFGRVGRAWRWKCSTTRRCKKAATAGSSASGRARRVRRGWCG